MCYGEMSVWELAGGWLGGPVCPRFVFQFQQTNADRYALFHAPLAHNHRA